MDIYKLYLNVLLIYSNTCFVRNINSCQQLLKSENAGYYKPRSETAPFRFTDLKKLFYAT